MKIQSLVNTHQVLSSKTVKNGHKQLSLQFILYMLNKQFFTFIETNYKQVLY